MRVSLVLVGRTIPAFTRIVEAIRKEFRAEADLEFMDFPMTRSFRSGRQQYDADVLLDEIGRFFSPGEKTIFVVREDIFSAPLNFVFGLARGDAAIVSTARLDPRFYGPVEDNALANALFKDRILKEIMHELGHTLGLPHCDDKKCVMVFSDSIAGVDYKGADFCAKCKKAMYLE
ncbi:MAG: archaemetzincin family Zn-dependent metalloprotease [Candidatus Micrarchaeota archaeon]